MEESRINDIFIAHAAKEEEDCLLANLFRELLNREGINGFIAIDYPEPGRLIGNKLSDRIRNSDICVLIVTDDYLKRVMTPNTWVSREIGKIRTMKKEEYLLVDKSLIENKETKKTLESIFCEVDFVTFRKKSPNEGFKKMIDCIKSEMPSFVDGRVAVPCLHIAPAEYP